MKRVRCLKCRHVFGVKRISLASRIKCPKCGCLLRPVQLPSSSAGESLMIRVGRLLPRPDTNDPPEEDAPEVSQISESVMLCPHCQIKLYVDRRKYGGKRLKCPRCREQIFVPRQ